MNYQKSFIKFLCDPRVSRQAHDQARLEITRSFLPRVRATKVKTLRARTALHGRFQAAGETAAAVMPFVGKIGTVAKDSVSLEQAFRWENNAYYSFKTSKGSVGLGAEVVENGAEMHLKNVAIYPENGSKSALSTAERLHTRKQSSLSKRPAALWTASKQRTAEVG